MTLQVIGVDAIRSLLAKLMQEGRVVAPHERPGDRQWVFDDLKDPSDAVLQYTSTVLPPKKYAFPPKETLVHYELGDRPHAEAVVDSAPLVLFGVHPCDIYGLCALDTAFSDEHAEANYLLKRAEMRVIGIDCEPDEFCFCGSMGTASVDTGFDLFLTPLPGGDKYLLESGTEAGEAVLEGIPTRDATAAETGHLKTHLHQKMQRERDINCDIINLPLLFAGFSDSPVWKRQAEKCYSCGTCNLTCPTCFCFDVLDQMDLSMASGDRVREWDGCMLEGFAKVAGGENFREDRSERLRHRFFRKYAYLFTRYSKPYCCGCGRCARQCLVGIDPVTVINDLLQTHGKGATIGV